MKPVRIPRPVQKPDGTWWIPRCPPHTFQSLGPYETRAEAEDDRTGLQRTFDSPAWRSVIDDLQEEGLI